ncbi:hypothetical protein BJY16_004914 [Actinoplanes octamycinicus]|uniref:Helix-turn-helix protein n=1 Tax=Actinoplanes octamycinicus TaxID=135948 RepID=A0A7W7H001_9ACTN|nr:helix-turn-helix transcriptional regulator [Actinoplanes octamycinicus]MBB4741455.1 hypothetical protein [Actinoplanes octamycinicus]
MDSALTALKRRSGRSFAALERRLAVSKSALHRYAAGDAVPPRWDIVRDWARECEATAEELADLERLWLAATVTEPDPVTETSTAAETTTAGGARRRRPWFAVLGALITLGGVGGAAYAVNATGADSPRAQACEQRSGVNHVDSRLGGRVWHTDYVCDNRAGAVLHPMPGGAREVAVMEAPRSWFVCWSADPETGTIWYYTRGDRTEAGAGQEWDGWGFLPGADVFTRAHPPAGMPACSTG